MRARALLSTVRRSRRIGYLHSSHTRTQKLAPSADDRDAADLSRRVHARARLSLSRPRLFAVAVARPSRLCTISCVAPNTHYPPTLTNPLCLALPNHAAPTLLVQARSMDHGVGQTYGAATCCRS